jgi:hypothetical protein
MPMDGHEKTDKRGQLRNYIEPYDTDTFLEFKLDGTSLRFSLLDTSPDGMGMLVPENDSHILERLGPGEKIKMEYKTPQASMDMYFQIRHISQIERGKYKGHHQVGLYMLPEAGNFDPSASGRFLPKKGRF